MTRGERFARAVGLLLQAVALGSLLFLALSRLAATSKADLVFRYQGF